MTRWLATVLVGALIALAAAACSTPTGSSTGSSAAVDDQLEPTVAPTATAPADDGETDPSALREVPPIDLPTGPVGSADAYDALIERLEPFVTAEQRADGVPWPDLRNPDPVAAYQETAAFQQWMMQHNPTPLLTEAYTAPNSPERTFDLEMFAAQNVFGAVMTPNEPPYSMQVEAVVHPAATSITDTLLADVPDGSVAVVYYDSSGSSEMVTESGIVVSRFDGWTNVGPWVAIMVPTEVGWQVWWDELTDPLPPGQDYERGQQRDDKAPRTKA